MIVLLLSLTKAYRHVKFLRVTGICSVTRPDDLSREFQQIVHLFCQATLSECPENSTSTFGWFVTWFIAISHYILAMWLASKYAPALF